MHGSAAEFPFFGSKTGKKACVKLHVIWDVNGEWIEDFRITGGRKNDSPISKLFVISRGKTYVFDRAYNDVEFWWKIVSNGADLVSRLKKCSYSKWRHKLILAENEGKDGVLWEGTWRPSYPVLLKAKHIPKNFSLRHIIYRCPTSKKVFDFITSNRKASAQTIANTYRRRWAVELLFRWLKGHLNVRYFSVKNPNSIRVLLAIAVLVQLLVQLDRILKKAVGSLWDHLRRIRVALWAGIVQNQPSTGPPAPKTLKMAVLQP
jgi:transposase